MAITRQTEKLTLTKSNRLLYTPAGFESIVTDDPFCDALVSGTDFKFENGNIEILDDKWLGRNVVVVYAR